MFGWMSSANWVQSNAAAYSPTRGASDAHPGCAGRRRSRPLPAAIFLSAIAVDLNRASEYETRYNPTPSDPLNNLIPMFVKYIESEICCLLYNIHFCTNRRIFRSKTGTYLRRVPIAGVRVVWTRDVCFLTLVFSVQSLVYILRIHSWCERFVL